MSKEVLFQVCLPKDGDDDSHVEVGLNGNMMVIMRGAEVSVKTEVYEILVNAGLVPAGLDRSEKSRGALGSGADV